MELPGLKGGRKQDAENIAGKKVTFEQGLGRMW